MKERPIIMTAESVRAILDGRKTQTRRVIKSVAYWETIEMNKDYAVVISKPYELTFRTILRCPFGVPGDRLWVRETWALAVPAGSSVRAERIPHYKADGEMLPRWKPSIHMPRWASRITLEITGVRVERLQEIKPIDTVAEGVYEPKLNYGKAEGPYAIATFANYWDSINAKRGYPWDSNPWVWVIEFERVDK